MPAVDNKTDFSLQRFAASSEIQDQGKSCLVILCGSIPLYSPYPSPAISMDRRNTLKQESSLNTSFILCNLKCIKPSKSCFMYYYSTIWKVYKIIINPLFTDSFFLFYSHNFAHRLYMGGSNGIANVRCREHIHLCCYR